MPTRKYKGGWPWSAKPAPPPPPPVQLPVKKTVPPAAYWPEPAYQNPDTSWGGRRSRKSRKSRKSRR
jgi:hypothetical protein